MTDRPIESAGRDRPRSREETVQPVAAPDWQPTEVHQELREQFREDTSADWRAHMFQKGEAATFRKEMRPVLNAARQAWMTAPITSAMSNAEANAALRTAFGRFAEDPKAAMSLASETYALLAMPEVVAASRYETDAGGYAGAALLMQVTGGQLQRMGMDVEMEIALDGGYTAQWLQDTRHDFKPHERDLILTALAAQERPETRGQIVALATEYLNHNPLESDEDRIKFLDWFWRTAAAEEERDLGDLYGVGRALSFMSTPFAALMDNVVKPAYLSITTSDEEYEWRQHMSIGQSVAIQAGIDPSEEGAYAITSGTIDGILALAADPVNWAFGFGIANKAKSGLARSGELLTALPEGAGFFQRLRVGTRAALPYINRNFTNLPVGSRMPSARFAYTLMSKTQDELITVARDKGMFQNIYRLAKAGGGIQELIEQIPDFARAEGLADLLTSDYVRHAPEEDAVEFIELTIRGAVSGTLGRGQDGVVYDRIRSAAADARRQHQATHEAELAAGTLNPRLMHSRNSEFTGDLYKIEVDANVEFNGSLGEALDGPSLLRKTDLTGEEPTGGRVLLLDKAASRHTLDFDDPADLDRLRRWANRHPNRRNSRQREAVNGLRAVLEAMALNPAIANKGQMLQDYLKATPGGYDLLKKYTRGSHVALMGAGDEWVLMPRARHYIKEGIDNGQAPTEAFQQISRRVREAEFTVRQWETQPRMIYHIANFPKELNTFKQPRLKPWRAPGARTGKKEDWSFYRRWAHGVRNKLKRSLFTPDVPPAIRLKTMETGAGDIAAVFAQMGATTDEIRRIVNKTARMVPSERVGYVRQELVRRAGEMDNPLIADQFLRFYEDALGSKAYGIDPDTGLPWAMGTRLSLDGTNEVRQAHPLALVDQFYTTDLPVPHKDALFTANRRFTRAQNMQRFGLGSLVEGLLPKAKTARRKTAEVLYDRMKEGGVDVGSVDDAYRMALAYAIGGSKQAIPTAMHDGWGFAARTGNWLNEKYRKVFSTWAVSQLITRPISWMGRVVVLEESMRGALMDLPSYAKNPFQWQRYRTQVKRIKDYQTWRAAATADLPRAVDFIFSNAKDIKGMRSIILKHFPGFGDAAALAKYNSMDVLQSKFTSWLAREAIVKANPDVAGNFLRMPRGMRTARRQSQAQDGYRLLKDAKFDLEWEWDDADILLRGLWDDYTDTAAGNYMPLRWNGQMNTAEVRRYVTGVERLWRKATESRLGRFALNRMAESGKYGVQRYDARALLLEPEFRSALPNARAAARHKGANIDYMDDFQVANWYLENFLDRFYEDMFGPLWQLADDPDMMRVVAAEALLGRRAKVGSHSINLRADYTEDTINTLTTFFDANKMDPRFQPMIEVSINGFNNTSANASAWNRRASKILETFGQKPSQAWQRRPAWLATRERQRSYLNALGWDDDIAVPMAEAIATDRVNYVYYNTSNTVPFLNVMNRQIPYFKAWWEVGQTWAYKIPALSSWGMGYAHMARKVDRTLDALTNVGLIEIDEEPGRFGQQSRRRQLRLAKHLESGNPVGDIISRVGWESAMAPVKVLTAITETMNLFDGAPRWLTDGWGDREELRFDVGNPLDIFSSGIGAVNQGYQVGSSPFHGAALTQVVNYLHNSVDMERPVLSEARPLLEVAEEWGMDPYMVMYYNRDLLRGTDMIGATNLERIQAGIIRPEDVMLPAGTYRKPGTSLWGTLADGIEHVFLPFGKTPLNLEFAYDFIPASGQRMINGLFGIARGGTPRKDPLDDTYPNPPQMFFSEQSEREYAAEFKLAIAYLENHDVDARGDGALTRVINKMNALEEFYAENVDALVIRDGQVVDVLLPGDSPEEFEYQRLAEELEEAESALMWQASDMAYGAMFMRGLTGTFTPATPKALSAEQVQIQQFWFGRDLAEELGEDGDLSSLRLPEFKMSEAMDRTDQINMMLGIWMDDEKFATTHARNWLRENVPSLWPHVFGASWWVPGGVPPTDLYLDEWSDLVDMGMYEPHTPGTYMGMVMRANVMAERETALVNLAGFDPTNAAAFALSNWNEWSEVLDEYEGRMHALYMWDEEFNAGEFNDWADRNQDDPFVLYHQLNEFWGPVADTLDTLSEPTANILNLSESDRRTQIGQMRATARQIKDALRQWREQWPGDSFNPRDRVVTQYFEINSNYYEKRADAFEMLDDAATYEEQQVIWGIIEELENTLGMEKPTINGVAFPSPLEFAWNAKSPEQREAQLKIWAASPPQWLSIYEGQKLAEEMPSLAGWVPDSIEDYAIYKAYDEERQRIFEQNSPDLKTGERLLSNRDKNRALDALDDWLMQELYNRGRGHEWEYREMTGAERLIQADAMPESLMSIVPQANAVRAHLQSLDKSADSDVGKRQWRVFEGWLLDQAEMNPGMLSDLLSIGDLMYGAGDINEVIMKFLGGSTSRY